MPYPFHCTTSQAWLFVHLEVVVITLVYQILKTINTHKLLVDLKICVTDLEMQRGDGHRV